MVGILFDLDQTLIDSRIADVHRIDRNWQKVYSLIPNMSPYEGIHSVLDLLIDRKIQVGIVTSSPRPYCTKVVAYHRFKADKFVCYHDTSRRKPHPDPILKGIELLEMEADDVWYIGDDSKDVMASHAAGVHSIAVTWGATDPDSLLARKPEVACSTVKELYDFLDQLTIAR